MSDTAKIIQACNLNNPKWHRLMNVVLSPEGICTAINTVGGGNLEPKVFTPKRTDYGKAVRRDYESGIIDESRRNMTALKPKPDGTANTLTSVQKDNLVIPDAKDFDSEGDYEVIEVEKSGKLVGAILQNGRIYYVRKLTPRECLRLMGWKDEQIDRIIACGMSNSQMYKQAGNGIVVDTLEAIFTMLFLAEATENDIDVSNYVEVNQIGF